MISLLLCCVWVVAANVLAVIPSKDNHWTRAYFLIAIGVPLLGYMTYENGPLAGILFLLTGMSVLRWPVIYLVRWIKRNIMKEAK